VAIKTTHNKTEFGVGDVVRVHQTVPETGKKNKERIQIIEGVVNFYGQAHRSSKNRY